MSGSRLRSWLFAAPVPRVVVEIGLLVFALLLPIALLFAGAAQPARSAVLTLGAVEVGFLGTIVAGVLWVFAYAALAATLAPGPEQAAGRLLLPSAILGGLFLVFDNSLDGFAFKVLAGEWAAASGERQASLMQTFETILAIGSGTFRAELLLFYGVTVLLAGLAVAINGGYPRWFGLIGAVAGGAVVSSGLLGFAGVSFRVDFLVVVILPLEGLRLLPMRALMWRRALTRSPIT